MSKAYENAQNNDRPRGAAQWRKYRAECERGREVIKQIIAEENKPLCICLEHIGDNGSARCMAQAWRVVTRA